MENSKQLDYDGEDWKSLFYVDEASPSGLKWNKTSYSFGGKKLEVWPGKDVGKLCFVRNGNNKAWRVRVKLESTGKYHTVPVHRVIAVLSGLSVNGKVVDHVNGDSSDNTVCNLRATTQAINSRNCKVQDNAPYGLSGIGCYTDRVGNSYFNARVTCNGKRTQKNFPIKTLGVTEAFRQAVVCREQMISDLNTKGAGYTTRHSQVSQYALVSKVYENTSELIKKTSRSCRKRPTNTSGITGVSFDFSNGYGRATAHWREIVCGKMSNKSKSFSVKKNGLLESFALACKHREDAIKELNQLGYGYSNTHGK